MSYVIRKRGASNRNFNRKAEFVAKVRECLERGFRKFDSELRFSLTCAVEDIPIVFVEKGSNAGRACWQRFGDRVVVNLEFNIFHIENYWDDMVEDTIPHEVAHVIDYMIRGRSNHDRKWQYIAYTLGCTGKPTHNYDYVPARKTRVYIYKATCGTEIKLTAVRHGKIQKKGVTYTVRSTGGSINRNCSYRSA